jgi:hypothetical protein
MQHWVVVSSGVDREAVEPMVEEVKVQVPEELVSAGVG